MERLQYHPNRRTTQAADHLADKERGPRCRRPVGGRTVLLALTIAFGFLTLTFACGDPREKLYQTYHERVSSVGDLDDDMIARYVKTMRLLRKTGISFEEHLAKDPDPQKGFERIERAIKEGGFKDYAEFVKVNAKVAWAWNMAQAKSGMHKQKKLNEWAGNETDRGIQQIDQALANPNVPEETKRELRQTRAALVEQKKQISDTWNKNKRWADWAMKTVEPLTNDRDTKVILRNERALMEVFTGLSREQLDQIQEHSMKHLGIE